jgi:cytidyltransferase-like protein
MSKIVCVSGYFDPLHIGHIEYFKTAKSLGDKLIVIVNNDTQAQLKKSRSFMVCSERIQIIQELKCVDSVIESIDCDSTVCKTLESLNPKPHLFCNGGDQFNNSIPEKNICVKNNIQLVDGLGEKIQSSSWLISKSKNNF